MAVHWAPPNLGGAVPSDRQAWKSSRTCPEVSSACWNAAGSKGSEGRDAANSGRGCHPAF
eukprot:2709466-Amphidinium_carterae.1